LIEIDGDCSSGGTCVGDATCEQGICVQTSASACLRQGRPIVRELQRLLRLGLQRHYVRRDRHRRLADLLCAGHSVQLRQRLLQRASMHQLQCLQVLLGF
jgi:hypothetical protein